MNRLYLYYHRSNSISNIHFTLFRNDRSTPNLMATDSSFIDLLNTSSLNVWQVLDLLADPSSQLSPKQRPEAVDWLVEIPMIPVMQKLLESEIPLTTGQRDKAMNMVIKIGWPDQILKLWKEHFSHLGPEQREEAVDKMIKEGWLEYILKLWREHSSQLSSDQYAKVENKLREMSKSRHITEFSTKP
jgi:hypothetical protein